MATALRRPPVNISKENKAAVLRLLASAHQITQEQIAEAVGVSQSGVSAYMSGQREIPNRRLESLGELFGLPAETFVYDAEWVTAQYQPALDDVSRFREKRLEKARSLLFVTSSETGTDGPISDTQVRTARPLRQAPLRRKSQHGRKLGQRSATVSAA